MRRSVVYSIFAGILAAALLGSAIHASASADRAYHFGFKKSRGGQPASIDQEGFKPLLDRHGAVFRDESGVQSLYLTFDNGYENGYTARILDVLREKKVPAAFFVTGHYVKHSPELVKRMAAEGHTVDNHSWSHPDMTVLSDNRIREELDKVKREVTAVTGRSDMRFLRPPRGIFSGRMLGTARSAGYTTVFWSLAYKDWNTKQQKGAAYAHEAVVSQLHPGAVLLLHSVSRDNAEALAGIIDKAREMGYTFKSLEELPQPPAGDAG